MSTGVIYDERMAEHKCLWDEKYNEKPERFTKILERCFQLNLLQRCLRLNQREILEEEILKLHSPEMITLLKSTENIQDIATLEDISSNYDFLYIHPSTYKLSLLAAGSTIELVDSILDGKIKNGMAIIRPPGHHAMKSLYCGYCYYNNVALAAQHALDNKGIQRILIVDWDIHHGQATQQMFYDDPRVLYFSIHGYQNGSFWPHLRESDYHYTGRGSGMGFNVNLPMNKIKMGNQDYMAIFHQLLLPIAYEYNPELIIVSAGYDAALGCPEGEMEITPACYSHFTSSLMGLAGGKIAVVLEGGYCLKSLAEGAALTLRTLLGDPCPMLESLGTPCQSVRETILSASYVLQSRWNCLQHFEKFSIDADLFDPTRIQMDIEFLPKIEFNGIDEQPLKYPTRDICPIQDPLVAAELDAQIDALIKETCLKVPSHRVGLIDNSSAQHFLKNCEIAKRCHQLEIEKEATDETIVISMMESLFNGSCRSSIAVTERCSLDALAGIKHVVDNHRAERILLIDWRFHRDVDLSEKFKEDPGVLCTTFYAAELSLMNDVGRNQGKGYTLNFSVPVNEGDWELLDCIFRVLLPIAYQFNPQLVVMLTDVDVRGPSIECFGLMVRQLSVLAAGRLALFLQPSCDQLASTTKFNTVLKALLGDAIPMSVGMRPSMKNELVSRAILQTVRAQKPFWSALQYDIKLPNENVLIPPYMNDMKVLQFNPQLKELFHPVTSR